MGLGDEVLALILGKFGVVVEIVALHLLHHITSQLNIFKMAVIQINAATQALPSDFPEKGFKATGKLSEYTKRAISPVGPYHLGAS